MRLLYEDDLHVQVSSNQIEMFSDLVRMVPTWTKHNYLLLISKKMKAILFGTATTVKLFEELHITYITTANTGDLSEFVDEIVSLGIILNNTKPSYGNHKSTTCQKM